MSTTIGLFVGAAAYRYDWFGFLGDRPSIPDQLDAVYREAGMADLHVVAAKRVDLHGAGSDSYFMVLRDEDVLRRYDPEVNWQAQVSDEVRIYDVTGQDDLQLRFRFRPRRADRVWLFRTERVGDVDENGRAEVLGAWEELGMAPVFPRPVVVTWDRSLGEYAMHPLLDGAESGAFGQPSLSRPRLGPSRGAYARGVRQHVYLHPTTIRDAYSDRSFSTYGVEDFVVERARLSTVLLAGFFIDAEGHVDTLVTEVVGWSINLQLPEPQVLPCLGGAPYDRYNRRIVIRPKYPMSISLSELWRARRASSYC